MMDTLVLLTLFAAALIYIAKPIISSVLSSTVVVDTIDNAVKMGEGLFHVSE